MHPTTAFTVPFGFVGWTIPSPPSPGGLPSSLYTFLLKKKKKKKKKKGGELRLEAWPGLPYLVDLGFPEFGRFT